MREKVGKSRNTVFFQWFVAPEGRKVGSLKRWVRSQLARWEIKNCTPLWHEAHFEIKMHKTHQLPTIFTSWDVEKVHAVVARSTFPSQNAQSTPAPDHFWQLRCWKVHAVVPRSTFRSQNAQNHQLRTTFGSWDVEKCTPLWREAHFEVKMYKAPWSDHFWRFRCGKSAPRCGAKHISKSECSKHPGFGPLLEVQMSLRFASLHYTTWNYTTLHSTTLHYITLHHTPQHYNYNYTTTLHYTPLHSTTLNYTTLHYTTLHSTTLHYTTLHYTTLPSTTLHYITPHYTPLHYNYSYNYNYTTTLHYTHSSVI